MFEPIWFNYNKITDVLLQLGGGACVQMNVLLYQKDMKGERKSCHNEYLIENNHQYGVTIKRTYNFFLSINKNVDHAYVMITPNDIILIRMKLEQATKWFTNGNTFKRAADTNQLVIPKRKNPILVELSTEKKWFTFIPVVIEKEEGSTVIQTQGIRMNLYDQALIDLTIDRFYGMKYLFDTVDMFTLASNMMNYIGRPKFGTNLKGINGYEQQSFFNN